MIKKLYANTRIGIKLYDKSLAVGVPRPKIRTMATHTMRPTAKETKDINNKNKNTSKFNVKSPNFLVQFCILKWCAPAQRTFCTRTGTDFSDVKFFLFIAQRFFFIRVIFKKIKIFFSVLYPIIVHFLKSAHIAWFPRFKPFHHHAS